VLKGGAVSLPKLDAVMMRAGHQTHPFGLTFELKEFLVSGAVKTLIITEAARKF
jgi:hypothetical protein